jgi:hypothetical protein
MQGNARPSLKECLVSIAEDESPPLKGTLEVDYIVLRRVNLRKSHVYVEFVDGDVRDGKEWFEGPVPTYMTIGALFGVREDSDRGERREMYGRERLGEGKTRPDTRKRTLRAKDETVVETVRGSVDKEDGASESTDDYATGESTHAVTRGAADTRRRTSHENKRRKSESLARVVDHPNDSYGEMETRSKTR